MLTLIDATVAVIEEGVFEILSAKHQESLGSQWIYNHVANSITRKWEAEHHMELLTVSGHRVITPLSTALTPQELCIHECC